MFLCWFLESMVFHGSRRVEFSKFYWYLFRLGKAGCFAQSPLQLLGNAGMWVTSSFH